MVYEYIDKYGNSCNSLRKKNSHNNSFRSHMWTTWKYKKKKNNKLKENI